MQADERFKFNIGDRVGTLFTDLPVARVNGRRYNRTVWQDTINDYRADNAIVEYRLGDSDKWVEEAKLTLPPAVTAGEVIADTLPEQLRDRARVVGYYDDAMIGHRWFVEETDELPEKYEIVVSPETKTEPSED